MPDPSSYKY